MALTQISTAGVKDDAVTAGKIPADAVGSSEIAANAVGSSELADNAVDTAAIAADAVTGAKIADDAVGAEHIEDLDAHVKWLDSNKAVFGTGDDFQIYHNGTNNYLDTTNGHLYLRVNSTENAIKCTQNGNVEISYDGSKKFETTSAGATITGDLTITDDLFVQDNLIMGDGDKLTMGDSDDLQIYHDGSNSKIHHGGSGGLKVTCDDFQVQKNDGSEWIMRGQADAGVELYCNNTKKLETNTSAVNVINSANSWSTISRAANGYFGWAFNEGNTTYGYLGITGGGSEIGQHVGAGNELVLRTESNFHLYKGYNHRLLETDSNAAVKLYYGGTKTFETILNGASMGSGTHKLLWPNVGNSNSRSFGLIGEDGDYGKFEIKCSNGQDTTLDETCIRMWANGQTQLLHDNTIRINTTANGATITGGNSISMDGSSNGQLQVVGSGYTGAIALNSSAMHIYHNSDARDLVFGLNETERLRLTTGGELKFATGSRSGNVNSICAANGNSIDFNGSEYMYFRTANSERARITSDGHFLVHATSNSSSSDTGFKILDWGVSGTWVAHVYNSGTASNTPGPHLYNLSGSYGGVRFYPRVDGGLANYQSNNSNLCDERAKTGIVDLGDQWSTVKQWKVRKFRYKKDPSDTPLKVGVIAQQIETVSPDLVEEDWPYEGEPNNPTTVYKTVKEEQMFMIAMKALQEAMAKIETLETKVAALEAA